uniref:Transmembrane protein n=1 Tax=Geobacillus sp. (strain WCH70) TaxID=471223 RepID=C5D7X2_GEOSW
MQEQIGKNNGIVGMLFLIENEYSYFFAIFQKLSTILVVNHIQLNQQKQITSLSYLFIIKHSEKSFQKCPFITEVKYVLKYRFLYCYCYLYYYWFIIHSCWLAYLEKKEIEINCRV